MTNKKTVPQKKSKNKLIEKVQIIFKPLISIKRRVSLFLARRPHRSFRRTRRRDYKRSLVLPGYWSFTIHVGRVIWSNRKLLLGAAAIYFVAMIFMVGLASQDTYNQMSSLINETSGSIFSSGFGQISQAGLMLIATLSINMNGAVTPEAQIYASVLSLFLWLVLVWILRSQLANRSVKLRDAIYNSGAPFVSTLLVVLILIIQLFPIAIGFIAYSAASQVGILDSGVEAMLMWSAIVLLGIMSIYWSISTILALVVVTLPGMYPLQAIKISGDLIIGRRLRVFLRLLWLFIGEILIWVLVMVPVILIDTWLKSIWLVISWIPSVPIAVLVMSSLTLLVTASYVYILYRKIVEDDSSPS